MAEVAGTTWRAEYGEIAERLQFRIGYIGSESYEAYFPIAELADLISVLTNVQALGINVLSLGAQVQARKVSTGFRTDIRIEPRSDTFPVQTCRFDSATLADLLAVLSDLQAVIGSADPGDWDDTRKPVIDYSNLPLGLAPEAITAKIVSAVSTAEVLDAAVSQYLADNELHDPNVIPDERAGLWVAVDEDAPPSEDIQLMDGDGNVTRLGNGTVDLDGDGEWIFKFTSEDPSGVRRIDGGLRADGNWFGAGEPTKLSGPDTAAFGDSITRGAGGGGVNWPGELEKLLRAAGGRGIVHNLGTGGETPRTITARAGGRPMMMTFPNGIPASGGATVTLTADDGGSVRPLLQGDYGVNPVRVNGIEGILTQASEVYTWTRSTPGAAVPTYAPVPVSTYAMRTRGNDITLIAMGQNVEAEDSAAGGLLASTIIPRARAIVESRSALKARYLVVGVLSGTPDSRATLENAMVAEFGRFYINMRQWMASRAAFASIGLTPTSDDEAAITSGTLPPSFHASTTDTVHLNANGYRAFAQGIYARYQELGWSK